MTHFKETHESCSLKKNVFNKLNPFDFSEDNSAPRGWKGGDEVAPEDEDFGGRRTLDQVEQTRSDSGDEGEWDSDGESIGEVDDEMAAAVERELFS